MFKKQLDETIGKVSLCCGCCYAMLLDILCCFLLATVVNSHEYVLIPISDLLANEPDVSTESIFVIPDTDINRCIPHIFNTIANNFHLHYWIVKFDGLLCELLKTTDPLQHYKCRHLQQDTSERWIISSLSNPIKCWHTVQRRLDGSISFDRGWHDYKVGFGLTTGNFWDGLESIHQATNAMSPPPRLRFELVHWNNETYSWAEYSSFIIDGEVLHYEMHLGTFESARSTLGNSYSFANGQPFTTKDRDNDQHSDNCANKFSGGGGNWYTGCFGANLNGQYVNGATSPAYAVGIIWSDPYGLHYSFKKSEIMYLQPLSNEVLLKNHKLIVLRKDVCP